MKKITAIILTLIIFTAGCGKSATPVPESEIMQPSESEIQTAPQKPTTSEAAKHNAQINPADVRIIQFDDPDPGDKLAVLTTSEGDITIRLFHAQAPQTTAAFEELVKNGYYNGQKFHTVVNGYKIEAGGASDGSVFPENKEFSLELWNFRGAVALANNGSDFIIVQANHCLNPISELQELNFPSSVMDKYQDVGGAPHQDWENPVFGAVISGMEIVDKIAAGKTADGDTPMDPIVITAAEIKSA